MAARNVSRGRKRQSNTLIIIILVLIVLLLIAAVVIGVLLLRKPEKDERDVLDTGVRGTIVTQDNANDLFSEEPDGYYNASMSIDWHFKDGVTTDAMIANKTTNTRTVYFDLYREDTGEVVYSSPYIPVGESMEGFTLDKQMDPGEYEMIVLYHLVDDDNTEVSTLSVGVTIYVE